MAVPEGMETFAARLASFGIAHPATKRRTSNAKGGKNLKWTHSAPSSEDLANAGFFFNPAPPAPDNTTCFHCQKHIDGWEADDVPLREHLGLSPGCGWAITLNISEDIVRGLELENPMSEKMSEARKATFGDSWPHEGKRGWVCKVQKMVDAGWYYCPTSESEDWVKCAYCDLSLDGWEPKDKPLDEHKKRSPGCDFFALSKAKTTKTTKSKKSRTSKASRMSIQSTNTATVEDQSMADIAAEEGDSHLTAATDMTMASVATTATKAGRKVAKPKKGKTKALSKAAKAKLEEAAQASSFIEPEDDDFDVKVNAAPSMAAGGRKRDSAQMDIDQEDPDIFSPPLKRRATQARVSPVVPRAGLEPMEMDEEERDTHMADAEDLEDLSLRLPVPNSGKQGRRKQGSSVIRKASTTSKGPLRAAIPADVELDATLETELDRPLTDDETPVETKEEQPKARRATRTRKAAASTAPARKTTRGTMPIDGSAENHSPYMPGETQSMEIDSQDVEMVPAELAVLPKNGKKGSKSQKPSVSVKKGPEPNPVLDTTPIPHVEDAHEMPDNDVTVITKSPTILLPKSRQGKSRQPSRQVPSKAVAEDSASSQTADGEQADIAGSDAKKVGRKASATTKKGKVSKKAAAAAQPLEDVPDMPSQNEEKISVEDDHDMTVVHTEIVQPIQAEPEPLVVEQNVVEAVKPKAARGRPKGKAENSRVVSQEKSKATNSSIVEDEPGMLGFNPPRPSQPVPATKPSKLPPTPQPAKHGLSSPTPSPQSSDAENQPPSSRPSQTRPPLVDASPSRHQTVRVPLASTPVGSPSTRNFASRLQTTYGWSSIDVDGIFTGSPAPGKQSGVLATGDLSSPEKKMTVEEWIRHNARTGEEKLRNECERIVGRFESEGVRALKVLEGIVCAE